RLRPRGRRGRPRRWRPRGHGDGQQVRQTTLQAAAGGPVTVNFSNKGAVMHNLHFYDKKGGQTLADRAGSDAKFVAAGQSETLTFTPPGPGTYYYQCDLHPDQMNGTFTVK